MKDFNVTIYHRPWNEEAVLSDTCNSLILIVGLSRRRVVGKV